MFRVAKFSHYVNSDVFQSDRYVHNTIFLECCFRRQHFVLNSVLAADPDSTEPSPGGLPQARVPTHNQCLESFSDERFLRGELISKNWTLLWLQILIHDLQFLPGYCFFNAASQALCCWIWNMQGIRAIVVDKDNAPKVSTACFLVHEFEIV